MRRAFAQALFDHMATNQDIHLLTADVGYGMFDAIRDAYPDRFWNVGAAEQLMIGAGVGLALAGKVPICYSITPFLLWRPAELIRNYLQGEGIPVILVGSGRDKDYLHDGPTHWAEDDERLLLRVWPRIRPDWPSTSYEAAESLKFAISRKRPCYINLRR